MEIETAKLIEQGAAPLGGQFALAEALNVSPQAVAKWKRSKVPAERVLDLERVTKISRSNWRPDLYPPEVAA
jgi:DNA-binding transcriptional regulator YdaS (Cro superfamily)